MFKEGLRKSFPWDIPHLLYMHKRFRISQPFSTGILVNTVLSRDNMSKRRWRILCISLSIAQSRMTRKRNNGFKISNLNSIFVNIQSSKKILGYSEKSIKRFCRDLIRSQRHLCWIKINQACGFQHIPILCSVQWKRSSRNKNEFNLNIDGC